MKVKVNRKDFIEVDNIKKIVETERGLRIYKKEGYPKIMLADCSRYHFFLRLVNVGVKSDKIQELKDGC